MFNSLRLVSFRNLQDAEIDTRGKDVFLVGENGQGKTNFLEAVYFVAFGSSFRGARDGELARNGEKDYSVAAKVTSGVHTDLQVVYKGGKKTISLDGKRLEDRKELLSVAPCVVFCHEDLEFVSGSPERRRWFFDQAISLYDPVYLEELRRFRQVLKSRNTLLKDAASAPAFERQERAQHAASLLDALDPQLATYGLRLMEKRTLAAQLFSRVFEDLYREVSGIDGVNVRYQPSWKGGAGITRDAVLTLLAEKRPAELQTGVSLSGPHRDRYSFVRHTKRGAPSDDDDRAADKELEFAGKASTGQRRLLALLLRVAQARRYTDITGAKPVLLLDDVLLEMDGEKRRKFLALIPDYEQAFYTFLPEEPYDRYRKGDTIVYNVAGGRLNV
jgi:DNA replication and repair protein RecF